MNWSHSVFQGVPPNTELTCMSMISLPLNSLLNLGAAPHKGLPREKVIPFDSYTFKQKCLSKTKAKTLSLKALFLAWPVDKRTTNLPFAPKSRGIMKPRSSIILSRDSKIQPAWHTRMPNLMEAIFIMISVQYSTVKSPSQ